MNSSSRKRDVIGLRQRGATNARVVLPAILKILLEEHGLTISWLIGDASGKSVDLVPRRSPEWGPAGPWAKTIIWRSSSSRAPERRKEAFLPRPMGPKRLHRRCGAVLGGRVAAAQK